MPYNNQRLNLGEVLGEVRSCRNLAVGRVNLIERYGSEADYTIESARGNKKARQEDYRRYLDRQIQERQENRKRQRESVSFDNSLSIIGLAPEDRVHFTRERKRKVDPEEQQKLKSQRQVMKNELIRQMQEQHERKIKEKLRKREEEQKEEERIKKEQAELARRRELEEQQEKTKMPKYNQCAYKPIVGNKLPKHELKAINSESALKLVGKSIVKSSARSSVDSLISKEVVGQARMITPVSKANSARVQIEHAKPSTAATKSEDHRLAPNEECPAHKNAVRASVETIKIIEEYQRQIEDLRNQNHLAKEEALLYKEQLLRELEFNQVKRLQPFIINPTKRQSLKECTNGLKDLPVKKVEVNPVFEESLCSSSKKVPGVELSKINEVMERSLCSETKLVAISSQANNELYATWKATEIVEKPVIREKVPLIVSFS